MRIAIGTDHGGIVLKPAILDYFKSNSIEVIDVGTYDSESVDYPVYAKAVGELVVSGKADKGILLCGTGIGISIAANKIRGIRAAVVTNAFCAEKCAEHNNANVLCMGGRVITPDEAVKFVDIWIKTPFAGGRHQQRVDMISRLEENL